MERRALIKLVRLAVWVLTPTLGATGYAQEAQWPIRSKTPPVVTQGFEQFGDGSAGRYHAGLALRASTATPVYPIADGEVVLVQLLSATADHGFGRSVILRHVFSGERVVYSQYSHLRAIDSHLLAGCKPDRRSDEVTLT